MQTIARCLARSSTDGVPAPNIHASALRFKSELVARFHYTLWRKNGSIWIKTAGNLSLGVSRNDLILKNDIRRVWWPLLTGAGTAVVVPGVLGGAAASVVAAAVLLLVLVGSFVGTPSGTRANDGIRSCIVPHKVRRRFRESVCL
jgi:hypothetical protein